MCYTRVSWGSLFHDSYWHSKHDQDYAHMNYDAPIGVSQGWYPLDTEENIHLDRDFVQ